MSWVLLLYTVDFKDLRSSWPWQGNRSLTVESSVNAREHSWKMEKNNMWRFGLGTFHRMEHRNITLDLDGQMDAYPNPADLGGLFDFDALAAFAMSESTVHL